MDSPSINAQEEPLIESKDIDLFSDPICVQLLEMFWNFQSENNKQELASAVEPPTASSSSNQNSTLPSEESKKPKTSRAPFSFFEHVSSTAPSYQGVVQHSLPIQLSTPSNSIPIFTPPPCNWNEEDVSVLWKPTHIQQYCKYFPPYLYTMTWKHKYDILIQIPITILFTHLRVWKEFCFQISQQPNSFQCKLLPETISNNKITIPKNHKMRDYFSSLSVQQCIAQIPSTQIFSFSMAMDEQNFKLLGDSSSQYIQYQLVIKCRLGIDSFYCSSRFENEKFYMQMNCKALFDLQITIPPFISCVRSEQISIQNSTVRQSTPLLIHSLRKKIVKQVEYLHLQEVNQLLQQKQTFSQNFNQEQVKTLLTPLSHEKKKRRRMDFFHDSKKLTLFMQQQQQVLQSQVKK